MNFDGWKGIKKLIHYTKEKRTVIHKPEMEEKSTEGKYVEELESSSPPTNSNMEQIPEDLRPTEQPSALKEVASQRRFYKQTSIIILKYICPNE
jgi:hypothetical protein